MEWDMLFFFTGNFCISQKDRNETVTPGPLPMPYVVVILSHLSTRFGGFSQCKYSDPWMQGKILWPSLGTNHINVIEMWQMWHSCFLMFFVFAYISWFFLLVWFGLWVYDKSLSCSKGFKGCYLDFSCHGGQTKMPGFAEPEHKNSRAIPLRWWWCSSLD